jgi:hypothetical protein
MDVIVQQIYFFTRSLLQFLLHLASCCTHCSTNGSGEPCVRDDDDRQTFYVCVCVYVYKAGMHHAHMTLFLFLFTGM